MATIFISYSNANQGFATRLRDDLDTSGHHVRFDALADANSDLDGLLDRWIINSDVYLVALSTSYMRSRNAQRELDKLLKIRQQRGTTLIPLLLERVHLPVSLANTQTIDFTAEYARALDQLLAALARVQAAEMLSSRQEAPQPRTATTESAPAPQTEAPIAADRNSSGDAYPPLRQDAQPEQVLAALRRAMDMLSPEDQLIVRMHFQEGRTVAAVARALNLEQKPLYRRVERLRTRLRGMLEREGLRSENILVLLRDPEDEDYHVDERALGLHLTDTTDTEEENFALSMEGDPPAVARTVSAHIPTITPAVARRTARATGPGQPTGPEDAAPEPAAAPPAPPSSVQAPDDEAEETPVQSAFSVKPASISDQPAARDALGFEPYVRAVAEFLTNEDTRPPLTLSIEGEWGSGKSSFMQQLQCAIQDREKEKGRKKAVTVWFNPWRHDREEALWAAFALEFLRGVSEQLPFLERWRGHFRLLYRRFSWRDGWLDIVRALLASAALFALVCILAYVLLADGGARLVEVRDAIAGEDADKGLLTVLLGAGGIFGSLAVAITLLKQVKLFIGNPLTVDLTRYVQSPDYQSRISFIEHFHEDFGRIVKAYVGERKVFVFIDDLDRCQTPKAADLMQALNLMMGTGEQPIIFILGMDREKIAASLAVKFKDLLPYVTAKHAHPGATEDGAAALRGLEYGSEFIEKFVQLSFRIPQPGDADVAALLRSISGDGRTPAVPSGTGMARDETFSGAMDGPRTSATAGDPPARPGRPRSLRETGFAGAPPEEPVRAALQQEVAVDSERLHQIVRMVAPALDYNPRRLKQFVNVFRLRAYLAIATGLVTGGPHNLQGLTFERLGKFVALGLRWPLLLADLDNQRDLLERLEAHALGVEGDARGAVAFWAQRTRLLELLLLGVTDEEGEGQNENWPAYGMTGLNIDALLQVTAPPSVRYGAGGTNVERPQLGDRS